MCKLLVGVTVAFTPFFFVAEGFAATNKGDVRTAVETKYEKVIWGKEIDHLEYLKFLGSLTGGPAGVGLYLQNLTASLAADLGQQVSQEMVWSLIKGNPLNIGGKPVYGGVATYNNWTTEGGGIIPKFKLPRPNTHQLYVAIGRKAKELPSVLQSDKTMYAGQLLFYRDQSRDGTGDVANPKVIGKGGWASFKHVFSGGDGIIYAISEDGRLLFFRDVARNGTGDVANPKVIGKGGWNLFLNVFYGGDGIIYAVDKDGRLLFYKDHTRNGTGDVANPKVIGKGGWGLYKHVFFGGSNIIYAISKNDELLLYRDHTRNGTGDVANPLVVGKGGWMAFKHELFGGKNIIYAISEFGDLLFYNAEDATKGIGDVANPHAIGHGGWSAFKFVFGGDDGIIYAIN